LHLAGRRVPDKQADASGFFVDQRLPVQQPALPRARQGCRLCVLMPGQSPIQFMQHQAAGRDVDVRIAGSRRVVSQVVLTTGPIATTDQLQVALPYTTLTATPSTANPYVFTLSDPAGYGRLSGCAVRCAQRWRTAPVLVLSGLLRRWAYCCGKTAARQCAKGRAGPSRYSSSATSFALTVIGVIPNSQLVSQPGYFQLGA
jgi:hypothetical protein